MNDDIESTALGIPEERKKQLRVYRLGGLVWSHSLGMMVVAKGI